MIDLSRFSATKEVIVPIVEKLGKIQGRTFSQNVENGWYKVSLGNIVKIIRKATPLEIDKTLRPLPKLLVYALGTEGIPVNFDNLFKRGFSESVVVNFIQQPIFSVAEIVRWEDNQWYYYGVNQQQDRDVLRRVREAFEHQGSLRGMRGITPEIRFYFLLANLQRSSYDALLEMERLKLTEGERKKRVDSFKMDIGDRIKRVVEQAGGTYIEHRRVGQYFTVTWKVRGNTIKSNIRDDMRITSAGFCLSGHDKEHSLNSIVQLAKIYDEDDTLNITRV